jgi:CMP-N,N'-diacetyllegionaminic acid synthase
MKTIAIIPARSGSKGLKDKNITELNGKPLMVYSIEAAQNSGLFDTIHVSTDSEKYAEIARQYGVDVPFLRDGEFASDNATTWDAVKNVLDKYEKLGKKFDVVTVLQPTSPLRDFKDIIGAWEFFNEKNANMVSSVCETDCSPLWVNTLPEDLSMEDFEDEEIAYLPRQSLPTYYRENGAIYIVNTEHLRNSENIYNNRSYAYIMDKRHSVDIDEEMDFWIASVILKNRNENGGGH